MKIPEIKQNLTIETVLSHYGFKPDRNNRLNCPWHNDKTPSLQIYPKTGTWTCFSSNCNAGSGDVIDFIMKYENISKYQAILKATELISLNTNVPEANPIKNEPNEIKNDLQPDTPLLGRVATLDKAFSYFKSGVHCNCKQATEYLANRGLDKQKIELGYNSGQLHHRVNSQYVESYLKTGVLSINKCGGYHVFAKHCIIFPLKDSTGQVVSLYGRSIYDNNAAKHYYLKDTQGLYPHYPSVHTKKLIIPESVIDTATLLQIQSITNKYELLAAYGTNRLTEEHIEAMMQLESLEEIIFFFDGDDAGKKAILKYAEKLQHLIPQVTISAVNTPDEEDVNSFYVKYSADAIERLIEERTVLVSGCSKEKNEQVAIPQPQAIDGFAGINTSGTFDATNHEALMYETPELHITVLGGIKISGLERMRATLKINVKINHYAPLRQYLDLYNNEQLTRLIRTVNEQMEVKTEVIRQAMFELIEKLENYRINRIRTLQPLQPQPPELSAREMTEAENYLLSPDLMTNTIEDLGRTGIVGETHNRIIMYLVFLSRITEEPLHIISFGASGTGKTHLQEKIGLLLPEHEKLEITSLSGNALYYFKHDEIRHKVLLIEDMDGAQEVLYPLRELQTKQKITKTVSLKDSHSNIKTFTFTVHGPVCISGCTTKTRVYEDNANRSILIYIDGSREQDERIMKYQREESAGSINKVEEEKYQRLLRHVQQMIKSIKVVNPYAPQLEIPQGVFKKRRSNWIYLRFIETITLYHQHQRPKKNNIITGESYIETTLDDIAWANKLLKPILLRKADELSEPARNFLEHMKQWLKENNIAQFKNKDIREHLHTTASSLKRYIPELLNCGLIKIVSGSKTRGFTYEITSYEEYERLKNNINHVLDSLLDKLRREESNVVQVV